MGFEALKRRRVVVVMMVMVKESVHLAIYVNMYQYTLFYMGTFCTRGSS